MKTDEELIELQKQLGEAMAAPCLETGEDAEELFFGPEGVLTKLTQQLTRTALEAELGHHLGYERNQRGAERRKNHRNGSSKKRVRFDSGDVEIDVPRDRAGTFEPQFVKKGQTQLKGFEARVLSLYSRGMSTRDIRSHLEELYGTEVSPSLISSVTDVVVDEVKRWRNRPLAPVWPVVYLDALVLPIRDGGVVTRKSLYLAVGVGVDGIKEVLGMWLETNEGARFWQHVLTELKNRGVQDILIACVDGLTGFPEAIEAVFPKTTVQTCIVHMIRNSNRYVSYKDRRLVCADLKPIYTAPTVEAAELALVAFAEKWDDRYPMISKSWQANWERVIPFLAFDPALRKVLYTTNAIESLNATLRKVIKNRGHFPSDQAAFKQVYLVLRNTQAKWTRPLQNWNSALQQLMVHFGDRIPV